jgi:hypothetical protein
MMRKLIFTLILILAGYVGFMYFFGQGEDKANAETIVNETKDLGKAVGDFIKRQKSKYDDGEFDRLIDKVGKTINKLKSKSTENEEEVKDHLRDLQKELKQVDPQKLNNENQEALKKLLHDIEQELK